MLFFLKIMLFVSFSVAIYHLKTNPLTAGCLFLCAGCIGHSIMIVGNKQEK